MRSAFPVPRDCSVHTVCQAGKTNLCELSFTRTSVPRSKYPSWRRGRGGYLWVINTSYRYSPRSLSSVKPRHPFLFVLFYFYERLFLLQNFWLFHCSVFLVCSFKAGWHIQSQFNSVMSEVMVITVENDTQGNTNIFPLVSDNVSLFPQCLSPSFTKNIALK